MQLPLRSFLTISLLNGATFPRARHMQAFREKRNLKLISRLFETLKFRVNLDKYWVISLVREVLDQSPS